jgi:serine/threonine-protein kinase
VQCPDENTLAALADGSMESQTRLTLARHLDTCSACRETVASLVRSSGKSDAPEAFARTMASEPPMPPAAPVELGPGVVVASRYRLERIVGEGGLGVVWAATHTVTQKPVALKITKFRFPELDKRFLREARVSGILRHPNIVDVHDVLQLEGDGALARVMDLLEGESLDRYLATRGRLSLGETMRIMHPVLSALAAAHAVGIVHRDLKPHNIFLSRNLATGVVTPMLLDFGLAKMTATEGAAAMTSVLTREKQLLGTPNYMAPEQLYGELDIDARTDVWAAGTVLFECLSGQRPLTGNSVGQIMRSLATREIPKTATVAPELPPQIAAMIDTMLTRDRAARPATVQPVVAAAEWVIASGLP